MNPLAKSRNGVAYNLLVTLTLLAGVVVLWQHAERNLWTLGFAVWVVVNLWFARAAFLSPVKTNPIAWLSSAIALAGAIAFFGPIPTTTLSMVFVGTPVSAEVTLNDLDRSREKRRNPDPHGLGWVDSDWISRHSFGDQRIDLRLDRPLGRATRNLEIRVGTFAGRYTLRSFAVGSDILGVAIPMTRWQQHEFANAPFLEAQLSRISVNDSGLVELFGQKTRPRLRVTLDRAMLSDAGIESSVRNVRLLWFVVFAMVPVLLWFLYRSLPRVVGFSRRTRRWLEAG